MEKQYFKIQNVHGMGISIFFAMSCATTVYVHLEIDTILCYIYSPININTKAKILVNAEKKSKSIYFYDDDVLERKIFEYWEHIGDRYFPEFPYKEEYHKQSKSRYEAKCLLFGNPTNSGASLDGYELNHLTLFKMFEMNICIINKEQTTNTITLDFKKIYSANNKNLSLLYFNEFLEKY